jgi:hypothetical protein
MRGDDDRTCHLFSYLSPEQRVPEDHPLRAIRMMTDQALHRLSPKFQKLYASTGRPSVPPERLLRALVLQVLYSVRSGGGRVNWQFLLAAATYNLVRMRSLEATA